MVIILPDHGTRYLGKVFNDNWMTDHNFLDKDAQLTAGQIIEVKNSKTPLVTMGLDDLLGDALKIMRTQGISQIPIREGDKIVGSLKENRVLTAILDDPSLKDAPVKSAISDSLPFVLPTTRIDILSKMINKDNPAVLVSLQGGGLDIITQYDLINILAM